MFPVEVFKEPPYQLFDFTWIFFFKSQIYLCKHAFQTQTVRIDVTVPVRDLIDHPHPDQSQVRFLPVKRKWTCRKKLHCFCREL